ncbi:MAG: ImmA/IrrE family metallo-endopeptidase [Roseibium sp.]|uniref:ImmA/IrrE family metallo-endopeptidase n=1 Tax=Roseibium sp. TaxID=1936156 RepID=UPI0026252B2D|nr:ImmA/IrrE family metallo-endopeptidase [Roseibium sp.]MCV0428721.1 ImmA/IrrE family metallo-endopeptidase [Roseibium sp.]
MSTVEKGNRLEDKFYDYLCDQKNRGDFVYGAHFPGHCKIYKKKKYPCKTREAPVEFDVVIELYGKGRSEPHLYVVFECKNHKGSIPEIYVNDFTSKLNDVFPRSSKGIIVVSTRLQSGAEKSARNRGLGIAKYDENGLDIIADRKGGICAESRFVKSQIFHHQSPAKSLKFSGYHDGKFFGAFDEFLGAFDEFLGAFDEFLGAFDSSLPTNIETGKTVPFLSIEEIQQSTQQLLDKVGYTSGSVDLAKICSTLSIDLISSEKEIRDNDGKIILGSANFENKTIQINAHDNKHRKRFTIGHEIGHFYLRHDRYLRSETIAEADLFIDRESANSYNYERLEIQANTFASELLLPKGIFELKTAEYRDFLGYKNRGHGYIFVDRQRQNLSDYHHLLSLLSDEFDTSKQAIEIKFKKLGLLNDDRGRYS